MGVSNDELEKYLENKVIGESIYHSIFKIDDKYVVIWTQSIGVYYVDLIKYILGSIEKPNCILGEFSCYDDALIFCKVGDHEEDERANVNLFR